VNRRYIASLAIGAVLTLVVGLFVRRELVVPATTPPLVVPPTQTAAFQEMSQEAQMRRMSAFFSDRAADFAALVQYVPASDASGLRWGAGDTLITTLPNRPVVALRAGRADTTRAPLLVPSDSMRGQWAVIVARRRDGGVVSAVSLVGGRVSTTCGGQLVSEYVITAPSHDGFAGAALFDLAGRAIGMVIRCGRRLAALPAAEILRLLSAADALGSRVHERFGFTVQPLDDAARRYFRADSGQLVVAVVDGAPAARAGWQPGDVIVEIDGASVGAADAGRLDALADSATHTVLIRRNGSLRSTRLSAEPPNQSDGGFGVRLGGARAVPGVAIGAVSAGSAADSAGLEAGDRLVRVGSVTVSSAQVAQRLLDQLARADTPTFLIFRRDSVTHGVLVRR
jgi:S1-C subfamily serine protease